MLHSLDPCAPCRRGQIVQSLDHRVDGMVVSLDLGQGVCPNSPRTRHPVSFGPSQSGMSRAHAACNYNPTNTQTLAIRRNNAHAIFHKNRSLSSHHARHLAHATYSKTHVILHELPLISHAQHITDNVCGHVTTIYADAKRPLFGVTHSSQRRHSTCASTQHSNHRAGSCLHCTPYFSLTRRVAVLPPWTMYSTHFEHLHPAKKAIKQRICSQTSNHGARPMWFTRTALDLTRAAGVPCHGAFHY